MIPPVGMAVAALTVMLWILWSDSLRSRRPTPVLYALRVALYLIVSGILILNLVRYPHYFGTGAKVVAMIAVLVGFGGAYYFGKRLVRRA